MIVKAVFIVISMAVLFRCGTSGSGTSATPTPSASGSGTYYSTSMTATEAKLVDPVLFGEWHDLSKPEQAISSARGTETFIFGKISQKYNLERRSYIADNHVKYTVVTNTTVTPHQATLTVVTDYSGKISAGTTVKCLYDIAINKSEVVSTAAATYFKNIIALPRRTLSWICSTVGSDAFPTSLASAQQFQNIDDGFNDLKVNSFTESSDTIEIPFDATNSDHKSRTWDKDATMQDIRVIINYTGNVSPAGTQIYLVHPDGTTLLIHDKLTVDTGKYFRTVGDGGFPVDVSKWSGKTYGDLSKYKLRLIGYTTVDVGLFRVGIYPTLSASASL